MQRTATLSKWGNSLAVRIPRNVAAEARVGEGDELTVTVAGDGGIVLRGVRKGRDLGELVSGISPANRHDEMEWGRRVGEEGW